MKKILPFFVVSILVLNGLGVIAIPSDKQVEVKPLNIKDWPIEIKVTGGLLGYKVTLINVGNRPVSGNFSMTITTDARIMLLGEELELNAVDFECDIDELKEFWMRPVLGFGDSHLEQDVVMNLTGNPYWERYKGETNGFVLLFFVFCEVKLKIVEP